MVIYKTEMDDSLTYEQIRKTYNLIGDFDSDHYTFS